MKLPLIFLILLILGCQDKGSKSTDEKCKTEIGCSAVTSSKIELALPFDPSVTFKWYGTLVNNSSAYISGSTSLAGNEDRYVIKIDMAASSLDSNFATNGVYNPSETNSQAFSGINVFNNDLYLIGTSNSRTNGVRSHDVLLSRFDSDSGILDNTFNTTGNVIQNYPGDWWDGGVQTVEIGSKIFTCGMAWYDGTRKYDAFISSYNLNGTLDTNFGTNGSLYIDFGVNQYERCFKIFQLDSGKFLVLGAYQVVGKGYHNFLTRYNSDWTIDISFGNSGISKIETSFYEFYGAIVSSEIIGDNLFFVASSKVLSTDPSFGTVMKVSVSDGEVVTSFGDSGILKMNDLCDSGASSLYGIIDSFGSNTLLLRGECSTTGVGLIVPITKEGKRVMEFNNNKGVYLLEADGSTKSRTIGKYKTNSSYKIFAIGDNKINVYDLKW